MQIFQSVSEPTKQGIANDRLNEKLTPGHDQARHGQADKGNGIGPVRRPLKRGEAFNFATRFGAVQFHAALAVVKQSNGQTSDKQQRATVGNDPVVANLAPSFTRCGEL